MTLMEWLACLGSCAGSIVPRLCDSLARRYHYWRDLLENVRALRSEMDELNSNKLDLKRRLEEEERALKIPKYGVLHWLQEADTFEEKVKRIEENFNQSKGWCLNGCCSDYKLGKKAVLLKNEVVTHKGKGSFEVVAVMPPPVCAVDFESVNVVGAERTLENIHNCIQKENVKIIGIYGMGGVGKTTLLKKINNEFVDQPQAFDVVIWVLVSQAANVDKIQVEIAKKMGLSFSEDEDQETRASKLSRSLRTRNFLLLLDDLWEQLDLEKIGVPITRSQKESKILLTTRSLDVCSHMRATEKIKVNPLTEDEAWDLFRNNVGEVGDSPILPVAKAVAKKCDGLPLALITVARAMVNRTTLEEWRDALTVLNKSASELQGMKEDVFYPLKFSYDNLGSDALKSCFLYCSLFPEDDDIDKVMLIEYWIAEGLIDWFDSLDEAYDRGSTLIGRLIVSCMLERGRDIGHVKMHDVMREMAISVASESGKWMVRAWMGLTRAPEEESKWREAERISLMNNKIEKILPTSPPNCPNLKTLLLQDNTNLTDIGESFFEHMPSLRVLDLSGTKISVLPPSLSRLENLRTLFIRSEGLQEIVSLGGLKQLQILNLAHCGIMELPNDLSELTKLLKLELRGNPITELPEGISKLIKLERLDLDYTRIKALPKGIGELDNLQYLYLRHVEGLLLIPNGVISKLSHLKTLELVGTRVKWIVESQIDDESSRMLDELECLRDLTYLNITIFDFPTLSFFLQSTFLLKCTTELEIRTCNGGFTQMSQLGLAEMKNLECLEVSECNELETMIIGEDLEESSLWKLQRLTLFYLPNLVSIVEGAVPIGCLEALYLISIKGCKRLRNIEGLRQLPNLQLLFINGCRDSETEMEVMIGNEAVLDDGFPRLKKLLIISCPRLRSICDRVLHLPSLQELTVYDCPKLKRLPLDATHAQSITFIQGDREWWEGLQWKDDNVKQALQLHFVAGGLLL